MATAHKSLVVEAAYSYKQVCFVDFLHFADLCNQMQRPIVVNSDVRQAGVQRVAEVASKATTNTLNMQDIARTAVQWSSKVVGRRGLSSSRPKRVNQLKNDGSLSYYAAEARVMFNEKWVEMKQASYDLFQEVTSDIFDLSPLSADFDYSYALTCYIWTAVIMASKTLGHRAARFEFMETLLESIFYEPTAALLLYILLPLYTVLINQKYTKIQLNLIQRRIVIIVLAFFYGLLGEYIWIHWMHSIDSAPYYYYPAVIGLSLQVFGPQFGADRRLLLGVCVSTAVVVSVGIASFMNVLTVSYIGATVISALLSLLNLQLLIADLRKHGSDQLMMVVGHYRTVIVSAYSHAVLTILCATYKKTAINQSDAAVE
ncbi:hypothetical protein M3Y98_00903000 [Aphelenchoides besseyi]|nr:hypothetical protein M3Y98_00903000 [Aphelenchoides besseyi]